MWTLDLNTVLMHKWTYLNICLHIIEIWLPSHFSRVWLCVTPYTAATRLPRPWDSPGKNTGVGYHFPLQCMKLKSERKVAQSCPTLSDPMNCSLPGSSVHGIFQASILECVDILFCRGSSWPRDQIQFLSVLFTISKYESDLSVCQQMNG